MIFFIKTFKGTKGILISMSLIVLIFLLISYMIFYVNRIELEADSRYSSISLDISPSPISASFVKVLYTRNFLEDHEQSIKSNLRHFMQLDPSDSETLNQLTSSTQQLLTQNQAELQLIKSMLLEEGCGDDLQAVKEKGKRKSLFNLHRGLQLLLLSVYHARSTQAPDQTAPHILSLIERYESKVLTCHQSLVSYMILFSNYYLFYETLLPLLSHPNLSPSLSNQVLLFLTKTLTPQRQEVHIKTRQDNLRSEYMILLNLLKQGHFIDRPYSQLGLQGSHQKETLLQLGYMWDANQFHYWIREHFRAQIWMIEQAPHLKLPKDLAIDQLQKNIDRFNTQFFGMYFSYNGIGQLLYQIVQLDAYAHQHIFMEKECMFRARFAQTLKRLKLDQPVILNPFTQHPFDLQSDDLQSDDTLSKLCSPPEIKAPIGTLETK